MLIILKRSHFTHCGRR